MQAFQIGTMGQRPLSRREQEERRKKEEEIAAASVFKEFVETFEGGGSSSKVWVKAGTYDAGSRSGFISSANRVWITAMTEIYCLFFRGGQP